MVTIAATVVAMLAFAGNSILCRMALANGSIDAASFTAIRLISGAIALALVMLLSRSGRHFVSHGSWLGAITLFLYAAFFSFAYISLAAATGALLLFGSVQGTMIAVALYRGERPVGIEVLGWLIAVAGLVVLMLPGATAPSPGAALYMAAAGVAWGVYSILGKKQTDALAATCANFMRSVVFVVPLLAISIAELTTSWNGLLLAVCSGALTSGLGYAIWYVALRHLSSLQGALVQLSVPAIAALGGVVLLSEALTLQTGLSGLAILGGVLVALAGKAGRSGGS
ncbi:MAG: DMT family transporter [Gammaproteobacteria bacterium]|nr:DMT family transporter [Gammaproteobacteria bacterium]